MARRIVLAKHPIVQNVPQVHITGNGRVDTYFDRLLKYIPGDVIIAWIAVTDLIKSGSKTLTDTTLWVAFIIFIFLTAVWILRQTAEPNRPPAITQTLISTGAFIVFVIALGGPFASLSFYQPIYGVILLLIYTLIIPLVTPPEG